MVRITVQADVLRWALERSERKEESARDRYPKFSDWLDGRNSPTLRQLEDFSNWTHTPFGFFMLAAPPEDSLPIPDFRTTRRRPHRPTPNLLDTVQAMQRRQEWMREFLLEEGQEPLPFVALACMDDSPVDIASRMREALGLQEDWAKQEKTWSDALRLLRHSIELADIMIVTNGVVGNNTHRSLDVNDFRGFALVDRIAPLIFINGRDAKGAQMFTIAHELAHLWLGREGVSNLDRLQPVGGPIETLCNKVAAEFLVPSRRFDEEWGRLPGDSDRFDRLARVFKVSAVVVARRAWDLKHINRKAFFEFYDRRISSVPRRKQADGGDFWRTQRVRIGDLFGSAVAHAVGAGRLLYRDAYELTGLRGRTFDNYLARLGI